MTDATFNEETQLLDWGETRSGGPWVKFRLPDSSLLDIFRGLDTATLKATGHRFQMLLFDADAIEQIANGEEPDKDSDPDTGAFWRNVFRLETFNAPPLLHVLGTDEQFREWVRAQPSCVSKESPCVFAHVRRANNSGTGLKPEYSGVALTDLEHKRQHNEGERALLVAAKILPEMASVGTAKEWFDRRAARYRSDWARARLHDIFEVDSCADISPAVFLEWCDELDLTRYIPRVARMAA